MGKRNGTQLKKATTSSRMFLSLHQEVAEAVSKHIDDLIFYETTTKKMSAKNIQPSSWVDSDVIVPPVQLAGGGVAK